MTMSPEEVERLGAAMTDALGRATDEQIQTVADLIAKQSVAIRMMKDQPPQERMKLAEVYTDLRAKSDLIWLTMLGMGIKMGVTPEGEARLGSYMVETGEPVLGTVDYHPPRKPR